MWVVKIDLISVSGMGIDFGFSVEIGIDLFFACRSKMTMFSCLERNELGFCLGASIST